MNFIVDLAFIVLIVVVVVRASQKGFVSTMVDTFSVVISSVASYIFTPKVAQFLYDSFIRESVSRKFEKALDEISLNANPSDKFSAMFETLPEGAVKLAQSLNLVNVGAVSSGFGASGAVENQQLITTFLNDFAYNVMITITKIVTFFALLVIFSLLVKFISSFLENINKIPFIGKFNSALGGVFGVLKAVVIVLVVCTVMYFIVASSDNTTVVSAISNSKLYHLITEVNPILNFIV